jgi:hypothetical protein
MKHVKRPPLRLYRTLFPDLKRQMQERNKTPDRQPESVSRAHFIHGMLLQQAVVFDCRSLPLDFIRETGDACFAEKQALQEKIQIPFPICYFEFEAHPKSLVRAIVAEQIRSYDGMDEELSIPGTRDWADPPDGKPLLGDIVRTWFYPAWSPQFDPDGPREAWNLTLEQLKDLADRSLFNTVAGDFTNGAIGQDEFFVVRELYTTSGFRIEPGSLEDATAREAAIMLLGALVLLDEKLVIDTFVPDPVAWWQRERIRKGKPPTSGDAHVLTVNVPAVRYAVSRSAVAAGTHESPCLHWRRGHSRTLHRGSEFESATWVRRCLVGDPDKGFVAPRYRLTSRLPMPGEVVH